MERITPKDTTNLLPDSEDQTDPSGVRQPVVPDGLNLRGSANLQSVYDQIVALCVPDSEDDDYVPPTRSAIERTFRVLEQTADSMTASDGRFPEGFVTTDDRGGLRIEWWHERSRCVTLMIDATDAAKDYTFAKLDDGKGSMDRPVVPQTLAGQLETISHLQASTGE